MKQYGTLHPSFNDKHPLEGREDSTASLAKVSMRAFAGQELETGIKDWRLSWRNHNESAIFPEDTPYLTACSFKVVYKLERTDSQDTIKERIRKAHCRSAA
jgi:hypothetical protein